MPERARRVDRQLLVLLPCNLLGALVSFAYFTFVDAMTALPAQVPVRGAVTAFVVGFTLIAGFVIVWINRWARVLDPVDGRYPTSPEAQRRALMLPYAMAGITFCGWALAGLIWGVVRPIHLGVFTVERAVRFIFGNTLVAGTATTALVFLVGEHLWRKQLPAFFPEGAPSAVPGALRLRVRTRLLVIFLLVGVVPLSVLGMMSYRRAVLLPGLDPAGAAAVVGNLLVVTVFIAAAGIAAAVGLALFVAHSVAAPLREVQAAMHDVERGNLDARCAVLSNDEIGAVAEGFNRMAHGLREREFLRETFGKYVTPEVRDEILTGRVALEGQVQEVTVLFADLRDFTSWVEATPPREVVRDLNAYFSEMDAAIRGHGGLVLQFIGDEIEAVFGAPLARADHAELAVRAALDMRARLEALNAERRRTGKVALRHGIGVHTGRVLAGNIGSSERLAYALVGDAVNLASRIQDLNKQFGSDILVSDTTRRLLAGGFACRPLPAVRVKGKSTEVEVYQLE
jgi:adenylate cyclase